MPQPLLLEIFRVRTREVDQSGNLKLSAIADYLQEAAARHTTMHGIGPFQLRQRNMFWVLSRLLIEVYHYPAWGEKVTVNTWPKGNRQVVASRDFKLKDESGRHIGSATSQWLLLNAETKKPCSLEVLPAVFTLQHDIPAAIIDPPPKIPRVPAHDREITHEPCYSDIDLNHHLNNTRYIDWAIDALPPQTREKTIKTLSVNYLSEIKYGENTILSCAGIDESTFDIEGKIQSTGIAAFRTRITF